MKVLTPETKQDCLALAEELTRGPALFDEFNRPTEAVLRYTGERVTGDTERCLMVGALRLLACSDRQIAQVMQCDVRTIPLMLAEAERTQRIPALKERLARLTGLNAERAQIALGQLLEKASAGNETIELAAMVKAVATAGGINTQNMQLLTGGATERIEVRVGAGRQEIEAWAREMAIDVTPVDCHSTEATNGDRGNVVAETARDTAQDPGADGRGGVAVSKGGGATDGLTGSKIYAEVPRG